MNRYLIISAFLFLCWSSKISAQTKKSIDSLLGHQILNAEEPPIALHDAVKMIGKDVYIYEEIRNYKTVNDSLTVLSVGGPHSKQQMIIILKGIKVNEDCRNVRNGKWHIGGVVSEYNRRPAIIITSSEQLGVRIQI